MRNYNSAYTFIEILLVIGLLSIITNVGMAWIGRFMYHQSMVITLHQLQQAFYYARSSAIFHRQKVTVCPSYNGYDCTHNWNTNIIVITPNFEVRSFKLYFGNLGHLSLTQSGLSNNKVEVQPNGMTYTNGHFTYKSLNAGDFPQFKLYFNRTLRFYVGGLGL